MRSLETIVLSAGTLLFSEGDAGSCAYLIKRGRIEIFLPRNNDDLILAARGAGEVVGEMAIIDNRPRSASARVAEEAELVFITAAQIAHRIAETDPILRMCLGVVIGRYRETIARLDGGNARQPKQAEVHVPAGSFEAALSTLSLESELRRALNNAEFEVHLQPIVRFPTCRLAGFEALMRWRHPERGLLAPAAFIPVAEASGLIVEITGWCLDQVGLKFPALLTAGQQNVRAVDPLFVTVNISGHDLERASFTDFVGAMLLRSGLPPGALTLEVTESVLMKDPDRAAATLRGCRALGVRIAVDDFGTGYSSLSLLSILPINTIKIDRSFIRSLSSQTTSLKIIQMILRLAKELGLPVVAEGIESADEITILSDLGCNYGQGYLFGKAMSFDQALAQILSWKPVIKSRPRAGRRKKDQCIPEHQHEL